MIPIRILTIIFVLCSAALFSQPKLLVEGSRVVDFGAVQAGGDEIKADVILKNTGDMPLRISDILTDCKCIKAGAGIGEIQPGATLALSISFLPEGMSGKIIRSISFKTDEPGSLREIIQVRAYVPPAPKGPLSVSPEFLAAPSYLNEKSVFSITIKNIGSEDITLTGFKAEPQGLFLEKEGDILAPAGKETQINLIFIPLEKGSFRANVSFQASSAVQPMIEIPGQLRVLSR